MQANGEYSIGFGRPWTPGVRGLILANAAVFLLGLAGPRDLLVDFCALHTGVILDNLQLWQLVTYMFIHANFFHLFFNMFSLWMFGSDVEEQMGTREFLAYYFLTGIGAGCILMLTDLLSGTGSITIGASGAVFGILLAYGMLFARRRITLLVFLILPLTMEARTFVILFALLELVLGVVPGQSGVAHFAHLGGLLVGFLYFKLLRRRVRPFLFGRSMAGVIGLPWRRSDEDDRHRLDAILDKINRYGIHTLTPGERVFLDEMSRRRSH